MNRLLVLILSLFPAVAFAHSAESTAGFLSGVIHPMTGWDHLLAMIAVGVLSSRYGGSTIWQVPAAFIASMLVGLYLGEAGMVIRYYEPAIALSLVLFGALIAYRATPSLFVMLPIVLFFGVFHGYAHGIEIGGLINPTGFRKGFFMGSVVIHVVGVMLGMVPKQYCRYHQGVIFSGYGFIVAGGMSLIFG
ncbi:HupE/UreJ family protein [Vibrio agarivorans]|uniref:HupE/UreJ family protein n=1 Tax=Vibrio agarivorans TaxID=153622 RepID=UPI00223179FE|nr:HupE/UreJ family protein [Vibrio agarivorans]MDN3660429.1 HupE/UreJ family protein [Vibrio agarivorans]